MKKLTILLLALSSISVQAQWWGNRVKGNGNYVTVERSVGDYDEVAVAGFFDVELVAGEEGELKVYGEENLLEHIITEVKGDRLKIKTEKGYNLKPSSWKKGKGIKITVPIKDIDAVYLSGSGDVYGDVTINSDVFDTSVSGSGDITLKVKASKVEASVAGSGDLRLSGTTDEFDAKVAGSGDIHAFDLSSNYTEVSVAGSGDARVNASEEIKARVAGSGDIRFSGNPKKQDTKTSGSGDISKS